MGLGEYKRKRKFSATPEPESGGVRGGGIFVVQLHHASRRHFDFRLELDGVLKSWAVPKGPSFDPSVKRLAVEVEDHPISYATFEGDIPHGNYGAGHVDVFDHGTWEPVGNARNGLRKGDLKFVLHGDVLRGSWVLVRTRREGTKNQWLLIKHADEYASERDANAFVDPKTDRPISEAKRKKVWPKPRSTPRAKAQSNARSAKEVASELSGAVAEVLRDEAFAPELCRAQSMPPEGERWLHELKWDGYRIVATVVKGKVRLWSRNAIEWTQKVPELAAAIASLGLNSAQLDGEMIVFQDGRDDFNALQGRLSAENKAPLLYMLFDLPHLEGQSLRAVRLDDRKAALKSILDARPHPLLGYSQELTGKGSEVFAQVTAAGMEGIVSKRADSPYRAERNGDWLKTKARASDEFVVIGFTEPKGSRSGIGALLLAKPISDGLKYIGRVGTGIGDRELRALRKQLSATRVDEPPADISLMERKDVRLALWVEPTLVVEVYFQGIGGLGLLRQPAFKALRPDKTPTSLANEVSSASKASTPKSASAREPGRKKVTRAPARARTAMPTITHPEREVFPGTGVTKGDVAAYYEAVAEVMLPEIAGRPLSVVRCPDGAGKACFFQKHTAAGWGPNVHGVDVKEEKKRAQYLCIDDAAGLLELVQMNVLEIHPWGAKSTDLEHADRIVFDLDPHASVEWPRVVAATRLLHEQLTSIGLTSFLRTSGGKGFHVVVPLKPAEPWAQVKKFAQAVAQAMAQLRAEEFVSVAGEKNREGKIFIDWLRNGRGSTSVASYSLRARQEPSVAMPIGWKELSRIKSGAAFDIRSALARIKRRVGDPWEQIANIKQKLPQL